MFDREFKVSLWATLICPYYVFMSTFSCNSAIFLFVCFFQFKRHFMVCQACFIYLSVGGSEGITLVIVLYAKCKRKQK